MEEEDQEACVRAGEHLVTQRHTRDGCRTNDGKRDKLVAVLDELGIEYHLDVDGDVVLGDVYGEYQDGSNAGIVFVPGAAPHFEVW